MKGEKGLEGSVRLLKQLEILVWPLAAIVCSTFKNGESYLMFLHVSKKDKVHGSKIAHVQRRAAAFQECVAT